MRTRIGTEGPFICFILWVETAGKKIKGHTFNYTDSKSR